MATISKISKSPPYAVEQILVQLGRNIRTARLRRKLRLEDLAERIGISRYVMSDIEKGKPTTSVAAYIGALWALGLADDMRLIADPDRDKEGKQLENARAPTTAPKRKRVLDNDF
jgi:transcriptional regulator with XRE-family HTH domain